MMMTTMAARMFAHAGMLRPRVASPQMMAATMKSIEIIAVRMLARFVLPAEVSMAPLASGTTANVPATIEANAATTRMSVR